jgi:hypothetical protein
MQRRILKTLGLLFFSIELSAATLGFVEQKFTDLHFEKGKWSRTVQLTCYTYSAQEDGAAVDVLRYGMSNLVSFKASKGLRVTVCGSIAAFEEGFETGTPAPDRTTQK